MRRYVIGDIHGCAKALRTLVDAIAPQSDDELVFLGDYVDRGSDSRNVVEQLIDLQGRCRVVCLHGNHEIMLGGVLFRDLNPTVWLGSGGKATITSYGGDIRKMPEAHRAFLKSLRPYYEINDTIFVHASYEAHLPMERQDDSVIYWSHLSYLLPPPHISGKRVFVGHTPQPSGRVMDAGHLVCIDTHCVGNGFLTAFNVDSNATIQVDRRGHLLRSPAKVFFQKMSKLFAKKPETPDSPDTGEPSDNQGSVKTSPDTNG